MVGEQVYFRSQIRDQRLEIIALKRQINNITKNYGSQKLSEAKEENKELLIDIKSLKTNMKVINNHLNKLKDKVKVGYLLLQSKEYAKAEKVIGFCFSVYDDHIGTD